MKILKKLSSLVSSLDTILIVDLASYHLKAIELLFTSKSLYLKNWMSISLKQNPNHFQTFAIHHLISWMKTENITCKKIVTCLAASSVYFGKQPISPQLSRLSKNQINKFLSSSVASQMEVSSQEIIFDYEPKKPSQRNKFFQVVAVKKENILNLENLFTSVKLKPFHINLDIYALERTIRNEFDPIVEPLAVINIESHRILYLIINKHSLVDWDEEFLDQIDENLLVNSIISKLKTLICPLKILHLVFGGNLSIVNSIIPRISVVYEEAAKNFSEVKPRLSISDPLAKISTSSHLDHTIATEMLVALGLALEVTCEH